MAMTTVKPDTNGDPNLSNDVLTTNPSFTINFPQKDDGSSVLQDAETFDVTIKHRIRIHDYNTLYSYPGLYDHLIEETLLCQSPQQLITLLRTHLTTTDPQLPTTPLRILDIGAGNGRVGLELRRQFRATAPPIARLVGTDLLESAKLAALRDRRPCPFDEYVVADLTQRTVVERFKAERFNVVTICAALGDGDGDLPLRVVDAAVEVLGEGGVLAFTVNGSVGVEGEGRERFGGFLESVRGEGVGEGTHWGGVREIGRRRYRHRLSVKGEWIEYLALVYRKVGEVNGVVDGKN